MYPSPFKNEGVTLVVNWSEALDQLLPRPVRARISGPKGPEILVDHIVISMNEVLMKFIKTRFQFIQAKSHPPTHSLGNPK